MDRVLVVIDEIRHFFELSWRLFISQLLGYLGSSNQLQRKFRAEIAHFLCRQWNMSHKQLEPVGTMQFLAQSVNMQRPT